MVILWFVFQYFLRVFHTDMEHLIMRQQESTVGEHPDILLLETQLYLLYMLRYLSTPTMTINNNNNTFNVQIAVIP